MMPTSLGSKINIELIIISRNRCFTDQDFSVSQAKLSAEVSYSSSHNEANESGFVG